MLRSSAHPWMAQISKSEGGLVPMMPPHKAGRERPTSAQQHLKGPGFTNKEREMMPAVFRHKAGLFPSANLPVSEALHLPAETVDTQADCPSPILPILLYFQPLQDYIIPPWARGRLLTTRAPVRTFDV